MRAFVVTAPFEAEVLDVPDPVAGAGEVVIDVHLAGVCGTDVEFFTGEMQYLHDGHAEFPMRLGHEWMGTVASVGAGVDPAWIGRRVTGDTMLGCQECRRCAAGRQHVCASRTEVGIRGGRAGALAERLAVPAWSLHPLDDAVDDAMGAMVEPAGNAWRCVQGVGAGDRLLVIGPGAIGLLVAMFARARGAEVDLLGVTQHSLAFARQLGFERAWLAEDLPREPYDAIVDASNGPDAPALALDLVEPGGRIVLIGLAETPSRIDTRYLALKDATAIGILSASPGLSAAIEVFAAGAVDPRPLVAATVGLGEVREVLAGRRPGGAGDGPKILVDPRRS